MVALIFGVAVIVCVVAATLAVVMVREIERSLCESWVEVEEDAWWERGG